jgi:hypothetical protein
VAVGGLFTFADTDPTPISARAYERAALRRLTAAAWQGVWRSGAHYGVLGALDYGPAGANRHWRNRAAVHTAFALYWPAPNRPLRDSPAAYEFTVGDVACFVLDAYSFADGVERPAIERAILGEAQRHWLANALAVSEAPFKVIFGGRPLLVPSADGFALHSFDQASRDFLKILDGPGTDGVVLVTGGGPVGELTRFIRSSGYPLHELSLGPLARSFAAKSRPTRASIISACPGPSCANRILRSSKSRGKATNAACESPRISSTGPSFGPRRSSRANFETDGTHRSTARKAGTTQAPRGKRHFRGGARKQLSRKTKKAFCT